MVTNFEYLAEKLPVLDLTNLKVSVHLNSHLCLYKFYFYAL